MLSILLIFLPVMCISNVYVYVMCILDKWPISRIFYSMIWKHLFPNIWFYSQLCNQTRIATSGSIHCTGRMFQSRPPPSLPKLNWSFCYCLALFVEIFMGDIKWGECKANSNPFSADCFGWQEREVWVPSEGQTSHRSLECRRLLLVSGQHSQC